MLRGPEGLYTSDQKIKVKMESNTRLKHARVAGLKKQLLKSGKSWQNNKEHEQLGSRYKEEEVQDWISMDEDTTVISSLECCAKVPAEVQRGAVQGRATSYAMPVLWLVMDFSLQDYEDSTFH